MKSQRRRAPAEPVLFGRHHSLPNSPSSVDRPVIRRRAVHSAPVRPLADAPEVEHFLEPAVHRLRQRLALHVPNPALGPAQLLDHPASRLDDAPPPSTPHSRFGPSPRRGPRPRLQFGKIRPVAGSRACTAGAPPPRTWGSRRGSGCARYRAACRVRAGSLHRGTQRDLALNSMLSGALAWSFLRMGSLPCHFDERKLSTPRGALQFKPGWANWYMSLWPTSLPRFVSPETRTNTEKK